MYFTGFSFNLYKCLIYIKPCWWPGIKPAITKKKKKMQLSERQFKFWPGYNMFILGNLLRRIFNLWSHLAMKTVKADFMAGRSILFLILFFCPRWVWLWVITCLDSHFRELLYMLDVTITVTNNGQINILTFVDQLLDSHVMFVKIGAHLSAAVAECMITHSHRSEQLVLGIFFFYGLIKMLYYISFERKVFASHQ